MTYKLPQSLRLPKGNWPMPSEHVEKYDVWLSRCLEHAAMPGRTEDEVEWWLEASEWAKPELKRR